MINLRAFFFHMNIIQDILYPAFLRFPKICTDTRKIESGSIFFALSGPSFNGNQFAEQALQGGCSMAVVDQQEYAKDDRYILVDDTLKALQDLAQHHRRQLKCTVIGITGSNGKTTSKELLSSVLKKKFKTIATIGNLNNHIGVPLTLLSIPEDTEMAVIEMGASKQGDIKELVDIAEPNYGYITNIGKAHLEGMGGYEGVVKTKTEMYDFVRANHGKVFVNTNHVVFVDRSAGMDVISFGDGTENYVQGKFLDSDPYVRFQWGKVDDGAIESNPITETCLMGFYNYENLLAAATVGLWFGVERKDIDDALSTYNPVNNRSEMMDTGKNLLIMDAYNANPTSMEAALKNLSGMNRQHKVAILGKMMELGPTWIEEHQKIAQIAVNSGTEAVFLVGNLYSEAGVEGATRIFQDVEEAALYFKENPLREKCILVKGSRSNRLETLKDLF
jgi:UDP-N-acetylmuramoyl-tripeptide--D-alanyl-D-alanine ligase